MTPLELRKVLAENLRAAAARRSWTLVQLADFAQVSKSQLYDVVGCRRAATVDFVAKISVVLEVPPWELIKPTRRSA